MQVHIAGHNVNARAALSHGWFRNRVHPARPVFASLSTPANKVNTTSVSKRSLCGCLVSRTRILNASSPSATRGQAQISAAWNQEIAWSNAQVSSNDAAATGLHKLVINVGKLAEGYKKAGQFVQVKVGDSKPGFFAIASPPKANSEGLIEVLIKDGGEGSTANLLCSVSQGSEVSVSPVMGQGFRMERAPAAELPTCLLFATGSGISPIKALIESDELQAQDRKAVQLYYGTRDSSTTAYKDLDNSWKAAGVETIHVHSSDDQGYVQDIFSQSKLDFDPKKTCAVMVGHKQMCEAVTKILTDKGVAKENILLNF